MNEGVNNLDVHSSPNQANLTTYSRTAYMNITTSTLALNSTRMKTHSYEKKNFSCIALLDHYDMLDFRFIKTNYSGMYEMGSINGDTFMTPNWTPTINWYYVQ